MSRAKQIIEGEAREFIKNKAKPPPVQFQFLKGSCCTYGCRNMDEPAQHELRLALLLRHPFDTEWFFDRKEAYFWRVSRDDTGSHRRPKTSSSIYGRNAETVSRRLATRFDTQRTAV